MSVEIKKNAISFCIKLSSAIFAQVKIALELYLLSGQILLKRENFRAKRRFSRLS